MLRSQIPGRVLFTSGATTVYDVTIDQSYIYDCPVMGTNLAVPNRRFLSTIAQSNQFIVSIKTQCVNNMLREY